jgi:hypothetical protein
MRPDTGRAIRVIAINRSGGSRGRRQYTEAQEYGDRCHDESHEITLPRWEGNWEGNSAFRRATESDNATDGPGIPPASDNVALLHVRTRR